MRNIFRGLFLVICCASLVGCVAVKKIEEGPLHNEVLVYKLPYDLTYLKTLDAVSLQSGWQLEETEKEKGIIRVQNTQYSRFDDADKRRLTFLIKRVDREHTSLSLAPESQRVRTCGDVLNAIDKRIRAEV